MGTETLTARSRLLGGGPWPAVRIFCPVFAPCSRNGSQYGEVDIIEGVHDNEHNQVAYHTAPSTSEKVQAEPPFDPVLDCLLDPNVNVTGTILVCSAGVSGVTFP